MGVKTIIGWSVVIFGGVISAFIAFLSFTSVWVGLSNLYRRGWWVAVFAGILAIALVFWLYCRATRAILRATRKEGLFVSME